METAVYLDSPWLCQMNVRLPQLECMRAKRKDKCVERETEAKQITIFTIRFGGSILISDKERPKIFNEPKFCIGRQNVFEYQVACNNFCFGLSRLAHAAQLSFSQDPSNVAATSSLFSDTGAYISRPAQLLV